MVIVGAFPPAGAKVFGGVISSCRLLLASSLPTKATLTLVDSTQISNPPPRLFVRGALALLRVVRFLRAFEGAKPDAVILFASAGASAFEKGIMARYVALRGVPALLFPRGGRMIDAARQSWFTRFWLRRLWHGAKMILCQGPAWQRFAVDELGFSQEFSPIVPNWTATPQLLEIGRARSVWRGDRPVELLFVGWVEHNKGVIEMIDAFRILARDFNVRLNIVGGGHAMDELQNLVDTNGLRPLVRFSGWLSTEEIETAYREADVFVLPSWAEGLPNAMVEAMAAKLAVVVSAVGNIPDVITDGKEAMLVPPKNPDALVGALKRIVGDAELRARVAMAGFALAEQEFAVEKAVTRLLDAVDVACGWSARSTSTIPG